MPCRCDDYEDPHKEAREVRAELDHVTDMLCWILGRLNDRTWLRPDMFAWWAKHQEDDRKRSEKELEEQTKRVREAESQVKSAEHRLEAARKALQGIKTKVNG